MASAAHTTMTAGYVIDGLKVIIDGGLCRGRSSLKVAPKTSSLCRSFHNFEHFFSLFVRNVCWRRRPFPQLGGRESDKYSSSQKGRAAPWQGRLFSAPSSTVEAWECENTSWPLTETALQKKKRIWPPKTTGSVEVAVHLVVIEAAGLVTCELIGWTWRRKKKNFFFPDGKQRRPRIISPHKQVRWSRERWDPPSYLRGRLFPSSCRLYSGGSRRPDNPITNVSRRLPHIHYVRVSMNLVVASHRSKRDGGGSKKMMRDGQLPSWRGISLNRAWQAPLHESMNPIVCETE